MPRIEVNEERCKGCELCIIACPSQALGLSETFNTSGYYPCAFLHPEHCNGCKMCAIICPDIAIEVFREQKIN